MLEVRSRAFRWLLAMAVVLLLPAGAWATSVNYNLSSGSISLALQYDGLTPISIGSASLSSGSVTFVQPGTGSGTGVTDFNLASNTSITFGPVLGYDTLTLNVALSPGSGYDSSIDSGSFPNFSISGGPTSVTGSATFSDTSAPLVFATMTDISQYTGSASISGNTLTVDVSSTVNQWNLLPLGWCNINGTTVYLLGSVHFVGVPEPGLGLLLLCGLLALAAAGRRSARAS